MISDVEPRRRLVVWSRADRQAAMPYGIEAFDTVLRPLWKGHQLSRGNFPMGTREFY